MRAIINISVPPQLKAEIEEAVRDVWQIAQDADGSRSGMSEALDAIQEKCVEVVPDIEDDEDEDEDGDGINDDDEEEVD